MAKCAAMQQFQKPYIAIRSNGLEKGLKEHGLLKCQSAMHASVNALMSVTCMQACKCFGHTTDLNRSVCDTCLESLPQCITRALLSPLPAQLVAWYHLNRHTCLCIHSCLPCVCVCVCMCACVCVCVCVYVCDRVRTGHAQYSPVHAERVWARHLVQGLVQHRGCRVRPGGPAMCASDRECLCAYLCVYTCILICSVCVSIRVSVCLLKSFLLCKCMCKRMCV
jgi:hypothetical protein